MKWRPIRQIAVDLALVASLLIVCAACDDGEPPKEPDMSAPSSVPPEGGDNAGGSDAAAPPAGDQGTGTESGQDTEKEETRGESTSSGTSTGTGTAVPPPEVTYQLGGAAIGDEAMIQAVKTCLAKKTIYDRFTGPGECTTVQTAKIDCNEAGIRKVLSAKQIQQFDDSLAGVYAGWTIDQCADCPPAGTAAVCANAEGVAQTGTKVLFVKDSETGVQGKSMVLPLRPHQPKS